MDKKEKAFLIILFLIALGFRLFVNYRSGELKGAIEGTRVAWGDEGAFDELARNILDGRGLVLALDCFKYHSLDLPFYPIFLSFIYATFGYNCAAAMIIQGILSAVVPVFIYLIGCNLFNKKVGYIGGILTAFYLPFVSYAAALIRETLFIFLFVTSIYLLIKALKEDSNTKAFWTGVFSGITSLTRGFGYGLLPLSVFWLFITLGKSFKKALIMSTVLGLGFFLAVMPWLLRNYYVHKGFLLGETTGGRHLWAGAHPDYKGYHMNIDAWRKLLWTDPKAKEMDIERRCWREAVGFITKDPLGYFNMCIGRRDRLWALPDLGSGENGARLMTLLIVYLAVIGMVMSIGNFRKCGLLILILLFDMSFHSLFGAIERFRLPIEWCLILFASYTIYCLMNVETLEWRELSKIFVEERKSLAVVKKQGRYIFLLIIPVILIFNYSFKLYNAYFLKVPKAYSKVAQGLIEKSLRKRGLHSAWKTQDENLGYKDLCVHLAEKSDLILADRYGEALGKYNSYVVIWEGELNRIPKKGRLTGFDLTINPGIHDIGEGTTWCYVDSGSADLLASNFTERQRVIVIARISGLSSLGTPMMTAYDVIPLEELKK